MGNLTIAHFGLRARDLPTAIDWYGKAFGAHILFRNEVAAFMSFDEEHHRFVIWDDGATDEKAENARGVDHIGFGCDGLGELADEYARLKSLGIRPAMCVNHGFTCSIYYHDPEGERDRTDRRQLPDERGVRCVYALRGYDGRYGAAVVWSELRPG